MVTRDSAVWWLAIIAAVLTYLVQVGIPPTEWPYAEWIKFASMLVATIAGKLATSPLAGKRD